MGVGREGLAMGRAFVLALALIWSGGARADVLENFAKKVGEAMAFADLCEELALNKAFLNFAAASLRIEPADYGADGAFARRLRHHMRETLVGLNGKDQVTICATGAFLYGPTDGKPGLLMKE
jgi:hypothetical protein